MGESILASIKKMLGLEADYTPYDIMVRTLINSALMVLNQLGVGPKDGFAIKGYSEKWSDFITNKIMMNSVQEYVYTRVRMKFDPPGNQFMMNAMEETCREYEQRLMMQAESVETFDFIEEDKRPSHHKPKENSDESHSGDISYEIEGENFMFGHL